MIIAYNLRPIDIQNFLNQNYKKKNGKGFDLRDVQGYIRRKRTPKWIGNLVIERNVFLPNVKLYHLKLE